MESAQAGDSIAYAKLLDELLPEVRRFVRRRVYDADAVEDVVQNVFLSIHRARQTWRSERPFSPWLYAVARNAVTDHGRARVRRTAREISLEDDGAPEPAVSAGDPHDRELSPELAAALAALPDKQREAVWLIHVDGLSVAEAAEQVGVTATALKVRAHRGYRALRERLARWNAEGGG